MKTVYKIKCRLKDQTVVHLMIHEETEEAALAKLRREYKGVQDISEVKRKENKKASLASLFEDSPRVKEKKSSQFVKLWG